MRLSLIVLTALCLLSSPLLAGPGAPQVRPLESPAALSQIKTLVQTKACPIMPMSCDKTVTGQIGSSTPPDCNFSDGQKANFWSFSGKAGVKVTLDLTSRNINLFMTLHHPSDGVVASDGWDYDKDAHIVHTLESSGTWLIGLVNIILNDTGDYTLSLECEGGTTATPPAAPSNLTATTVSSTEVRLGWQDNSGNEDEFSVQGRPSGGSFETIGSVAANSTGADVFNLTPDTTYDFRVRASNSEGNSGYSNRATATTQADSDCMDSEAQLCLNKERFKVEVEWEDFNGNTGVGQVVPFGSADSGLLWFFDADNWEMLIKVLDGCSISGSYWVFAAATTNVEYTLRITDTATDSVKSYTNPLGTAAAAITDTGAFSCAGDQQGVVREATLKRMKPLVEYSQKYIVDGPCMAGDTNMCLNLGRFRVEVDWRDRSSNVGSGEVVPVGSADSGLFYFFDADNWEMLIKILDGGKINDHFWVFSAATTTVEYTLRVTDTVTGTVKEYFNPLDNAAAAITDNEAFVWSNFPPLAEECTATTRMNESVEIPIVGEVAEDRDGKPVKLKVTAVTQPAVGGVVSIAPGGRNVVFNPDLGFVSGDNPVTFTYTVSDGEDSTTANGTVEVLPQPTPTCADFAASPTSILPGESSTLSWTSTNGVSAAVNGVDVPLAGPYDVSPQETTPYTLVITGEAGTTPASCGPVTVEVSAPPPTCSMLKASPTSIWVGASSTLSWESTNGVSAAVNGVDVPLDGPYDVSPQETTDYTLVITGEAGTPPASCGPVTVTATTPPQLGTYRGLTSRGKVVSIKVEKDGDDYEVRTFKAYFTCPAFYGWWEVTYSSCKIGKSGTFQCGSANFCITNATRVRTSGTFDADSKVEGAIEQAIHGFSSCCIQDVTYDGSWQLGLLYDAPRERFGDDQEGVIVYEDEDQVIRVHSLLCADSSGRVDGLNGQACKAMDAGQPVDE